MKKLIVILLSVFVVVAFASCENEGNWTEIPLDDFVYDYNEYLEGYEIYEYEGTEERVRIPDKIDGKPVISISYPGFYENSTITAVYIPDSVEFIIEDAFNGCSDLAEIRVPDTIYIGRDCFDDTSWYDNQPDGFVILGKTVLGYKGEVSVGDKLTIPEGVTSIAGGAFEYYEFSEITIPSSVKIIGEFAFDSCEYLQSIIIPDSVTELHNGAFHGCSGLESVTLSSSLKTIEEDMFTYCESLTEIVIPEGVESIDIYSFFGCTNLENVVIPNSLTEIADGAFARCDNLNSESVEKIHEIGLNPFDY